ncbi:MAG TPA: hypothetical protein VLC08_14740 [Chitinolyticbacter sp.]|nr:hypothetical protein [Chitinolyticbacter sp.]
MDSDSDNWATGYARIHEQMTLLAGGLADLTRRAPFVRRLRREKMRQLHAFAVAFREINRRVGIGAYHTFHLSKQFSHLADRPPNSAGRCSGALSLTASVCRRATGWRLSRPIQP